jgi:dUTP pyrophosphatase
MNTNIPVRIKNASSKILEYKTSGAVGFDFEAANTVTIEPGKMGLIDTWVVVEIPLGYMMMLAPRSSTFKNYGLMMVNSVGIIDQDYCGETDTNKFAYINMTDAPVTVPAGERIGQGILVAIARAEFELVESMGNADRGGFGTTGR